jgi:hypothetical protein
VRHAKKVKSISVTAEKRAPDNERIEIQYGN